MAKYPFTIVARHLLPLNSLQEKFLSNYIYFLLSYPSSIIFKVSMLFLVTIAFMIPSAATIGGHIVWCFFIVLPVCRLHFTGRTHLGKKLTHIVQLTLVEFLMMTCEDWFVPSSYSKWNVLHAKVSNLMLSNEKYQSHHRTQ